jgi:protein arginine kinase activator
MMCESCQKNPATVHLTDVSNNSKREVHLCETCAEGHGVPIKSYLYKPSFQELLTQVTQAQAAPESSEQDLRCPRCGITYRKFRATGKFGCPQDYEVFRKELLSLMEKIHNGKVNHVGKVPLRAGDQIARQKELRSLRAELEKAIQGEAYERAADLRDRIHKIEGRKS